MGEQTVPPKEFKAVLKPMLHHFLAPLTVMRVAKRRKNESFSYAMGEAYVNLVYDEQGWHAQFNDGRELRCADEKKGGKR